ncbi:hypothetical protein PoB_001133500 [Plakobranchus ocellatus]|uniref:Uncharacterized protein n=1 Tax=Plakobranchus ocellatus TaxID=259542 RepID=A0AAV3YNX1_9GAST|nr:hypothetical protein PoB_001133500 [Plakobranchus ocellatus]
MYFCHNVAVKDKATGNATSRRAASVKYHLEIDGEKIPVCKTFCLHTLGLSDQFVFTTLSKKDEGGHISPDMRGRHTKMSDLMKEERERIRAHIRSFPAVESHYCRKDSERLYLGASLNLATMYRLYCETRHKEQAVTIASSTVYCELFRTEFNLGFHNPSKDRCDFCVSFKNLSLDEKDKQKHLYNDHHRNKARPPLSVSIVRQQEIAYDGKNDLDEDIALTAVCVHIEQLVHSVRQDDNTPTINVEDEQHGHSLRQSPIKLLKTMYRLDTDDHIENVPTDNDYNDQLAHCDDQDNVPTANDYNDQFAHCDDQDNVSTVIGSHEQPGLFTSADDNIVSTVVFQEGCQ